MAGENPEWRDLPVCPTIVLIDPTYKTSLASEDLDVGPKNALLTASASTGSPAGVPVPKLIQ